VDAQSFNGVALRHLPAEKEAFIVNTVLVTGTLFVLLCGAAVVVVAQQGQNEEVVSTSLDRTLVSEESVNQQLTQLNATLNKENASLVVFNRQARAVEHDEDHWNALIACNASPRVTVVAMRRWTHDVKVLDKLAHTP
jgi:hypothetical protein